VQLTTLPATRGRRPTKFTPEKVDEIRLLVTQGKRREEIAEAIGVTVGSLQVTCSRLEISLRRTACVPEIDLQPRGGLNPCKTLAFSHGGSGSGPLATPHGARENVTGSANLALKIKYRGQELTTELPLTQDVITQLAFEAQFRAMSIGELVGKLLLASVKRIFSRGTRRRRQASK
jgi:hypothetical protein